MNFHHLVANTIVGVAIAVASIGLGYRRSLEGSMRWLLAWVVVDAVATFAGMYTRIVLQNAQHVAQIWYPVSAGLALATAANALGGSRARQSLFIAAVLVPALIVALTVLVEEFGYFSRYTGAIHGFALVVAGAMLVIRRAVTGRGEMMSDPIFLVGAAFLIVGAPSAFLALSRWHFPFDRATQAMAYTLKNILSIVAYALTVAAFHHARQRTVLRTRSVLP